MEKLSLVFDRNDTLPWAWTFADEILTQEITKITDGMKLSIVIEEFKSGHIYEYVIGEEIDQIGKLLLEKILIDENFYQQVLQEVYHRSKSFKNFCEKIRKEKYTEYTDSDLLRVLQEYVTHLKALRLWGWVPALIDGVRVPFLTNACMEGLRRDIPHITEDERADIFSTLTTPDKFGEVQKAEIEKHRLFIKYADELSQFVIATDTQKAFEYLSPQLQKQVEEYVYQHAWLTYANAGPTYDIELFKKDIKELNIRTSMEYIAHIEHIQQDSKNKKEHIVSTHALRDDTKHIFEIARECMQLKEYRKSIYQYSYVSVETPLRELARRIYIPFHEIRFLNLNEMNQALQDPHVFKRVASERAHYCVIVVKDGVAVYYSGAEAKEIIARETLQKVQIQKDQFTGQVAFPGIAKGPAKLVFTAKDNEKVNTGDILLSSSTNPDLLPAMKKAAAIVTDFGGIICHAAIVSRELKIPCVIGTTDITKHIKDGEMLYVDAARGTVTKI